MADTGYSGEDCSTALLCGFGEDVSSKTSTAAQAHPFFAGVDWAALEMEQAPYVPTVTHELDTQNFEEFEEKESGSNSMGNRRRVRADPNFIGYTYKNWEAVSPREGVQCISTHCMPT